jgi:hypothetical protein
MRKTYTARQLAEYSAMVQKDRPYSSEEWARRNLGQLIDDVVTVEVSKAGRVIVLSNIRFSTTNGRKNTRIIDCLEDGKPTSYSSDYQFQVLKVNRDGLMLDFTGSI